MLNTGQIVFNKGQSFLIQAAQSSEPKQLNTVDLFKKIGFAKSRVATGDATAKSELRKCRYASARDEITACDKISPRTLIYIKKPAKQTKFLLLPCAHSA